VAKTTVRLKLKTTPKRKMWFSLEHRSSRSVRKGNNWFYLRLSGR